MMFKNSYKISQGYNLHFEGGFGYLLILIYESDARFRDCKQAIAHLLDLIYRIYPCNVGNLYCSHL